MAECPTCGAVSVSPAERAAKDKDILDRINAAENSAELAEILAEADLNDTIR